MTRHINAGRNDRPLRLLTTALILLLALVAHPGIAWADTSADGLWVYNLSGNEATITSYKGSDQNLVVPSQVDGHTVVSAGFKDSAFKGFTTVELPATLVRLEPSAFSSMDITSVIFDGDTLGAIPDKCFYFCDKLESITIPRGVQSIGESAFTWCERLKTVTFQQPSQVKMIHNYAFDDCKALTGFDCPMSVTYIGFGAFSNCSTLKEFMLLTEPPSGGGYGPCPLSVNSQAFVNCTNLKHFYSNCTLTDEIIQSLGLPNDAVVMTFYYDPNGNAVVDRVYTKTATSVTVPSQVQGHYITGLDQHCFARYPSMASVRTVSFPDNDYRLTVIEDRAFMKMTSLTSIALPPSVKELRGYTFYGCTALASADLSQTKIETLPSNTFSNCSSLEDLQLPHGLKTIEEHALANCYALGELHLPVTLKEVANYALATDAKSPKQLKLFMPDSDQDLKMGVLAVQGRHNKNKDIIFVVTCGSYSEAKLEMLQNPEVHDTVLEYIPVPLNDKSVNLYTEGTYTYDAQHKYPTVEGMRWFHVFTKDDTKLYDANNVNAGGATIVVAGDGTRFASDPTVTLPFTIEPASMSITQAYLYSLPTVSWDGDEWRPHPEVFTNFGVPMSIVHYTLKEGIDYQLSYQKNVDAGQGVVVATGSADVNGDGTGNFKDDKQFTFTINPRSLTEEGVRVAAIPDQVYTGSPITPRPKVEITNRDGDYFTLGYSGKFKDIACDYENNTEIGQATAIVKAYPGNTNFTDAVVRVPFNIVKRDLATVTIDAIDDQTYTGSAIVPDVVVRVDDDLVLTEGKDYKVSVTNNTNVGTATVTVTGTGDYCTGSTSTTFQIVRRPVVVKANDLHLTYGDFIPELSATVEGTVGSDKVAYQLSREPGENAGAYAITVTGEAEQGNYSVTFEGGTLTIDRRSIANAGIPVLTPVTYKGSAWEVVPSVMVGKRTLVPGTDIELTYANNVDVGAATVTIAGINNYKDTLERHFAIVPLNISGASFSVPYQMWAGSVLEPRPDKVTIAVEGGTLELVEGTHYTISWENNTKPGTGKVTLSGMGNCTGSCSALFEIHLPADLSYAEVKAIPAQTYTGNVIHPNLMVTLGDAILVDGTDFEYQCYDTNVGTAAVTLRGLGAYEGTSLGTTFQIIPRDLSDATLEVSPTAEWWGNYPRELYPKVTLDGRELYLRHDYECSFKDNVEVGSTATVTVTGIGNYTGTASASYQIVPYQAVVVPDDLTKAFGAGDPPLTATLKWALYGSDTVSYTLTREQGEAVGSYVITATGERYQGNYELVCEEQGTFTITSADISAALVTAQDQTYEGVALRPGVHVEMGGKTLVAGTDYEVSGYANNTNVGTATVTIRGLGNYTGQDTGTFKILPKTVTVTPDDLSKTYGEGEPTLTATVAGTIGADTVAYELARATGEDAGSYAISATGEQLQGNYAVAFGKGVFTINPASIAGASVTADGQVYDGAAWEPEPTVTLGDKTLTAGKDYEVSGYANNVDAGEATVSVTGKGNYAAGASGTFVIAAYDISGDACAVRAAAQVATGEELKPVPVLLAKDRNGATLRLAVDTDFTVTGYENNVTAPQGTVFVQGTGNFTGTNSGTFTIYANPVALEDMVVHDIDDQTYTGAPIEPSVRVESKDTNRVLVEGVHYTVSYENNVNAGTATAVVTGIMPFKGTIEQPFKIVAADLKDATVTAVGWTYDGKPQTPKPTVTLGKQVLPDTDYDVAYDNNVNAGNDTAKVQVYPRSANVTGHAVGFFSIGRRAATVVPDALSKVYGQENPTLTATVKGLVKGDTISYELSRTEGEDVGTYAVQATGEKIQGNYEVTYEDGGFVITPASIEVAYVTADEQGYTGSAVTPDPLVKLGDTTLCLNRDYTVVDYAHNVDAGSMALIRVRGIGNYTGTATGHFTITPKLLTDQMVDDPGSAVYNGMQQKPSVSVTDGDKLLVQDRDYRLSYGQNLKIGPATVTVTGKGNYAGEVTTSFTIERRPVSVTARNAAKTYGEQEPMWFETDVEGVVDELLLVYDVARVPGENVGDYVIEVTGEAEQGNYAVSFKDGTFTIRQASIASAKVSASDTTYTGKGACPEPTVTLDGMTLNPKKDYKASYINNVNAGTATVVVEGTGNYVGKAQGAFTIAPAPLTVRTGSAEKPYDGTPLVVSDAQVEGLIEGEEATAVANGSQTEMGSSDNTYDLVWGKGFHEGNYRITEHLGTLTVTANNDEVKLTAASASKLYDGTPLTCGEVTVTGLPDGLTAVASATGTQTNAAASANVVDEDFVINDAAGKDHTACFTNVKTVDGRLEVTKRQVSLTSASSSKTYDGLPLTVKGVVVGGDGYATGEGATYTVSGSQLLPGSSANTFAYALNAGTLADNYDITTTEGTLTVTDRPADKHYQIEVASSSDKVIFDGDEHTVEGFETLDFEIAVGDAKVPYSVEGLAASIAGTDAGSYQNAITGEPVVRDAEGNDVSAQFDVALTPGSLVIDPADLTSAKVVLDNQIYSGKALEPVPVVVLNGKTLVQDTDYTVAYRDNVNVGTARVEISGIGNYTGVAKGSFAIDRAVYRLVKGGGMTFTKKSNVPAEFVFKRSVDDETTFERFVGLQVDGRAVDSSNYEVRAGSAVVTLKPAYVNALSAGTHTIRAEFDDEAWAEGTFTIRAASDAGSKDAEKATKSADSRNTLAKTDDPSAGGLSFGLLGGVGAALVVAGIVLYLRRRG